MSLLIESGIETIVNWKPTPETTIVKNTEQLEPPLTPKESADFNVSSRVVEYKIAWDLFTSHPGLGNGLGTKHEMRWETSNGTSFTQFVAYIHNWPLYILMVGGVLGILTYSIILIGPILIQITSLKTESEHWTVIRTVVLTMAIYGLFFAVFRLITFNLLLAAVWGVIFARTLSREYDPRTNSGKDAHLGEISTTPKGASNNKSADQKNMELPV
ncbi:O-Antigen ligase [compost metagenome]